LSFRTGNAIATETAAVGFGDHTREIEKLTIDEGARRHR
jgi:hypothetical protein